jgi:putative flippase GtrA
MATDVTAKSYLSSVRGQLVRCTFVGAAANIAMYALYLALTFWELNIEVAATICFIIGVLAGFGLHRHITFQNNDVVGRSRTRYVVIHPIAYCANIGALYVLVTHNHQRHEIVQLSLMVISALGLFLGQRYWVFYRPGSPSRPWWGVSTVRLRVARLIKQASAERAPPRAT